MQGDFFAPSQYHLNLMGTIDRQFEWRGQQFAPWQSGLRERLCEMVGPMPERREPPEVEEREREELDDHVRMKLVFTSEPWADVPAYLLVPKGREGPLPGMICLQGHSPGMGLSLGQPVGGYGTQKPLGDRDYALQSVRNGFVALAVEQRCFGERQETEQEHRWEHTCLDAVFHSLLLGKTMIGERVWDVMRAVDLLGEQPEVDSDRIGCMGNSGGGTVTFYAACLDPRIRLAVVSCAFCAFGESLMRIQHCGDNYIPGMLRVAEMGELAGLIAPRRMIVVAGQQDEIFPISGVRAAFETASNIFEAAGCPGRLRLVVGEGGHRFYAEPTWPLIHELMAPAD